MAERRRTAVLISGRGSNLEALLRASAAPDAAARIDLVVADHAQAPGLRFGEAAGVATRVVERNRHSDRASFESALEEELQAFEIQLICLAGFMRILSRALVERWRDRMLNVHPSLLPAFPGLDTHARALAAGVRIHGCTVHLVRPEVDAGPIIVQAALPVRQGEDAASLAARVLALEHRIYPCALEMIASGRARIAGERVWIADDAGAPETALINPSA